jgi:hypothetical protein
MERELSWRDVYDARKIFPADWYECKDFLKKTGYKYIAFNGHVFHISQENPDYTDAICMIEDLT